MTYTSNQSTAPTETAAKELMPVTFEATGHVQSARGLAQLSSDYFAMEERSFSGWLAYMRGFASQLNFIDTQTLNIKGNWLAALPDAEQALALQGLLAGEPVTDDIKALATRPDISVLLAFFTMMQYPFEQYKRFTRRHQQHYYREVLGFKTRAPVPDKSHVVLILSDDVPAMTLLKGTKFDGGADQAGNALVYQTKSNTLLTHASVDKVITLSRHKTTDALVLTTCADLGQDIEMPADGVLTFGESQLSNADIQLSPALGFTLASPELYLSGGLRTLDLKFDFKEGEAFPDFDILRYFDLAISGVEGMLPLTSDTPFCTVLSPQDDLTIRLERLFPAISHYLDESLSVEAQALLPKSPYLSFILKASMYDKELDDTDKQALELLRKGVFNNIHLTVKVVGVSGIVANNSQRNLDTASPFTPFGSEPGIAAKFEFTHPELLVKRVEQASLTFSWLDRPVDWQKHYQAYLDYRQHQADEGTTVTWTENLVTIYHSDRLDTAFSGQTIFSPNAPVNNLDQHQLIFISQPQTNLYSYANLSLETQQANQWPKWFSLVLSQNDFGHGEYSQVVQYTSYLNMAFYSQPADPNLGETPLEVNQPYTPMLDSLLLNYQSQINFNLDQVSEHNKIQHIHPLGRQDIQKKGANAFALLPQLDALGYLYIGLSGVVTPGQFRLYFQLDPVDGSNIKNTPKVDWHYLTDSGWTFFDNSHPGSARIIEDSTYKLLDSGVVTFELPELAIGPNFIGDSRFWIRLSIGEDAISEGDHALYSRINNIYAQGVVVELVGLDNDPSHFLQPLPAESISELVEAEPRVEQVLQPYPSFGGKSAEPAAELAIRASERLRHKNRAVTAWDYEHLLLAQFPELFLVRCFLNVKTEQTATEPLLAKVAILVVPVNFNLDILQPKVPLYLKRKIQAYVEQISPLAVTTTVLDPDYEVVQLELFAQISPDFDIESIEGQLNQIIIDYMTPWNGITSTSQVLTKEIYLTELAAVLERHDAVDSIYVMRASQALANGESRQYRGKGENKIEPSEPASILVPAQNHNISLFNSDTALFEGVGKWRIDLDFKVT
ncbi:hypothetical protein [uncultured Shewanella sp.]|uniref:hypothetical protein n=1 Tax=uncultured Shewanella sp. TaxID=173975 RepID=UPI00261877B2|nr:hypothetical protein [uncultured Shewanella sp.]